MCSIKSVVLNLTQCTWKPLFTFRAISDRASSLSVESPELNLDNNVILDTNNGYQLLLFKHLAAKLKKSVFLHKGKKTLADVFHE